VKQSHHYKQKSLEQLRLRNPVAVHPHNPMKTEIKAMGARKREVFLMPIET
jgi:hypothetical protein